MSITPQILVAEDNRVLAEVIRFNLDNAGLDVELAHDGRTALRLAEEREFDLIISDYQMPGFSGEELLMRVRLGHCASRCAAAILCSAKGYELDSERLKETLGIDRIVLKPFSPSELVAAAQAVLASRSADSLSGTTNELAAH